jgi:hypothetical protein
MEKKIDLAQSFTWPYILGDRLCGLVVIVLDHRSRDPGFDFRALQKK